MRKMGDDQHVPVTVDDTPPVRPGVNVAQIFEAVINRPGVPPIVVSHGGHGLSVRIIGLVGVEHLPAFGVRQVRVGKNSGVGVPPSGPPHHHHGNR